MLEIAAIYGVSLADLMTANDITNPNLIFIGELLVIPDTTGVTAADPTAAVTGFPTSSVDGDAGYGFLLEPADSYPLPFVHPIHSIPLVTCNGEIEDGAEAVVPDIILCTDLETLEAFASSIPGLEGTEKIAYALVTHNITDTLHYLYYDPAVADDNASQAGTWFNYTWDVFDTGTGGSEEKMLIDVWRPITKTVSFANEGDNLAERLSALAGEVNSASEGISVGQIGLQTAGDEMKLIVLETLEGQPAPGDYIRSWCRNSLRRGRFWFCRRSR